MNDPNQVQRFRPELDSVPCMVPSALGMWVHIGEFWELKNEWIKQNILLEELTRMIKKGV